MVFVKGHIEKIIPNQILVYTVFDPNNIKMADVRENYLTVTYELNSNANITTLTVTQGDFNTVADGEKRYNDTYNNGDGWGPLLREVKKMLEVKLI